MAKPAKTQTAADEQSATEESAKKRNVHRSPNYPAINLETALKRARSMLAKEGRHDAPVNAVLGGWGYTNFGSSIAQGTLSALVKYGLLKSIGSGKDRKVQLTESALKILLDEREPSPERDRLIQAAAILPPIFKELWDKWGVNMPSDVTVRTYLLMEKEFNPAVVDEFIKDYKSTIAFAKLDKNEGQEKNNGRAPAVKVGDFVQWTSQGVDRLPVPQRVLGLTDDGDYAYVEGSETGLPMSELTIVDPPVDSSNPKPPAVPAKGQPPVNPLYKPPAPPAHDGPRIEFPLPNDNTIEIRLKKPVSKKDFDRIIKLVQLSEDSLVGEPE